MPRTRASVPSRLSPSQCTTSSALATHSHTVDSLDSRYDTQIAIAASTPSAVRSSGRTQRGSRAAIQRSARFSTLASRKFGSRSARTASVSVALTNAR